MAKPNNPRKTNRYSAEFKLQAVKLSKIKGVQVRDVADALDIHPFMLSRWRKEAREGLIKARVPSPALPSTTMREMKELARLKRDHALLEQEHALLKKAIRFTSARRARSSPSSSRKRTTSA